MAKIISDCCGKEVAEKYGINFCKGCGYQCGTREVSECCEAEIATHQPSHSHHPEAGPADPIECCTECGKEVR